MKTIIQIANKNHVSRTTIYYRMKKVPDFKKNHMTYNEGKWLIDDSGVKLLSQHKRNQPKHYNVLTK